MFESFLANKYTAAKRFGLEARARAGAAGPPGRAAMPPGAQPPGRPCGQLGACAAPTWAQLCCGGGAWDAGSSCAAALRRHGAPPPFQCHSVLRLHGGAAAASPCRGAAARATGLRGAHPGHEGAHRPQRRVGRGVHLHRHAAPRCAPPQTRGRRGGRSRACVGYNAGVRRLRELTKAARAPCVRAAREARPSLCAADAPQHRAARAPPRDPGRTRFSCEGAAAVS